MSSFAIATLGCKVNAYESESYIHNLKELGYKEVDFKESADVYIINTCAVTNTASSKSRQKINQAKKRNQEAMICIVGCFVQTTKKPEDLDVDVLIGSSNKQKLAQLIHQALHDKKAVNEVVDIQEIETFEEVTVNHFEQKTRAFLKIQDGCNQYCSYCIIPYARGKERSMDIEDVVANAKRLSEYHQEIVLTGIHTGRYGRDIGTNLLKLLKRLVDIPKLKRIRISSIEITELNDELLEFIRDNEKIAKHLHIPIQSGADKTLKRMNRPYTVAYFKKRVETIRKLMPMISISSDIILGFPSESKEEFLETCETVRTANFSFLHVFPFSQRDGTKAANLEQHLDSEVKKFRCRQVSEQSKKQYIEYISQFINQDVEVLFEYEKNGYFYGHSDEYVLVKVKDARITLNTFEKVTIEAVDEQELIGKLWR